jgi:hypothetical protein
MEYRGEVHHDGRHGYSPSRRDHAEYRHSDYRGGYHEDNYPEGDYRGGDYRGGDYSGREMSLSKADMKRWKKMLKNSDGSTGEHFSAEQMHDVIHHVGAKFEEYDEADLCMVANMLYSDLGEALRPLMPKEKEPMVYAKMARYWLEDEDGPKGAEKLALYYYCIVEGDE